MGVRFTEHLRRTIPRVDLRVIGDDVGWVAPLAIYDAPHGFGEECWSGGTPDTIIAIHRSGSTVVSEIRGFTGRWTDARRRGLALQPRGGCDHYRAREAVSFGHFYITDGLLARVAEGLDAPDLGPDDLRHDLVMFEDDTLHRLLGVYAERSTDVRQPPSRIEMEARALLVVERLIAHHHLGRGVAARPGGLAPWQVRRTQEAMDASLETQVSLDDLAAIAGCSPTHFSRAFKQSVGVPPFEWLHGRRIERAKDLLTGSKLPLAEVALAVGFAAQPQFTTAFGKATGVTPGAWRRERRA